MPTLVLICAGVSMACQSKIASLNVLIHSLLRSISAQLPTMSYGCGTLAGPGGFASQRNADSYRSEPGKGACNAMQLMSFISAFVDPSLRPRFNLGIAAASRSNGKHNPQHFVLLGP